MKSLSIFTLVFITLTFVPNGFAQVLSQKHLPEGAIARIGKGSANDVKYSPDGTLIAVASTIGIWIYDAQTYQEIDLFTEHSEIVWNVAFSPDGRTLAGANNGTVKLWDVDTGQHKATLKGGGGWIPSVAFSPDGQTLASGDWNELKLWDVKTRRHKATLKGHTNVIWSVAFSPDGRTLASGSRDKTVRLWDVNTKQLKSTLTDHKTEVKSVAYSPDGRTLAGGSWYSGGGSLNNTVCLWDAHTGRLKSTVLGPSAGVAFSPDGRTLASVGWTEVSLLDANTGRLKARLRRQGFRDFGGGVAFSPDGQTLASAHDSMVKLWDVSTERHKADLTGHAGTSPNIAFSSDGQTLASTDYARVPLWDANTGKHKTNLVDHSYRIDGIAFSPDGQTLASVSWDRMTLWDVNTGQRKTELIGHTDRIWSIAFSRNGQTLVSGSSTEVRLWDVDTGQQKTVLQDPNLMGVVIAYSPDGRTLATRGRDGLTLRLWNTVTGEPLKVLTGHKRYPRSFAFSPDGSTLVSGGQDELLLWDVVGGEQSGSLPTEGRCNASGLALSPDGKILVTEWSGTHVALWDVATGKQLTTFSGHGDQHQHQITSLVFNPNGNMIASASVDGTVLLWDLTPFIPQQTPTDAAIQRYEREMVRLVYFRPSDRPHREDIDSEFDTVIKWAQYFYAEQMADHGDRKTFAFETEDTGYARVHHVTGKFTDTYYHQNTYAKVVKEITEQFDTSTNVYLIAIDVSSEFIDNEGTCGVGGGGWNSSDNELWRRDFGGVAVIPASGICINPSVTAHELGHVFGLEHDFRDDAYLMAYGTQERLSPCAAEWLDAHRFFNTDPTFFNAAATVEMRVLHAAVPETFRLQFKLWDADGLHQAQLLVPTTASDPAQGLKLQNCKSLDGTYRSIEFAMTDLRVESDSEVTLQVIDKRGNITKQTLPVADMDVAVQAAASLQLGAAEVPEETALLPNYPNPFNPETWIPYQLAIATDVTLRIYAADGRLIRRLTLGYLPAGRYENRSRAAYWDGRNELGERVASGVYFYTLTADKFTATRKLLISK